MGFREDWIWILLGGGFVFYLAVDFVRGVLRRRRELAKLVDTWGQPLRSDRSHRDADRWYRRLADDETGNYRVDDHTWADLEMDRVFVWADHTLTALGAQVLYTWLRQPRLDLDIAHARLSLARSVSTTPVRTRLQRILADLGDRSGWGASIVVADPGPDLWGPRWMYSILAYALGPAVAAAALLQYPALVALAILVAAVNPMLHAAAARKTAGHIEGLHAVKRAVAVATRLYKALPVEARGSFPDLAQNLARARKAIRMPSGNDRIGSTSFAGVTWESIAEYRRAFFLTEVRAYLRSVHGIQRHRDALRRVLELVGSIDAAISVAYLEAHDDRLCEARGVSGNPSIEARALRHPLLRDPVPNDVRLGPRSLLVTGSNMAGKSTFLRTVGVNMLLAQTLGLACADAFACSSFRVLASMQARDDLGASVSLYQAELQRILELLRYGADSTPCLVLLDEVFRGTNPADRLCASAAVLLELGPSNLVIAATHDLALADITREHYDVVHFTERADEDGVVFDYQLRPGVSRRTNALALLQRLGYPDSVVRRAHDFARTLHANDDSTTVPSAGAQPGESCHLSSAPGESAVRGSDLEKP